MLTRAMEYLELDNFDINNISKYQLLIHILSLIYFTQLCTETGYKLLIEHLKKTNSNLKIN